VVSGLGLPDRSRNVQVYICSFQAVTAVLRLLGPYLLPPLLAGAVYYNFSRKIIQELLQDVDLKIMVHA
jgi:hypothetical protein